MASQYIGARIPLASRRTADCFMRQATEFVVTQFLTRQSGDTEFSELGPAPYTSTTLAGRTTMGVKLTFAAFEVPFSFVAVTVPV